MKSLAKALRAFGTFEDGDVDLSVTEICARTGMQKSQVSKILQVLREHGLLQQSRETRRYSVGLRAFSIGSSFVNNHMLSHVGLPVLRQLADAHGHSTTLSILGDDRAVHLLAVEGPHFVDARWRVGRTINYHVAASARVLLAWVAAERVDAILARFGLPRMTERTITDPDKFKARLGRIRRQGFDVSRSEGIVGLGALAVPVFGPAQGAIASLGILFPEPAIAPRKEPDFVRHLHQAARAISVRMGATVYPFGPTAEPALPRARRLAS
jgi:IclR family acetate operon transcriptional repressor